MCWVGTHTRHSNTDMSDKLNRAELHCPLYFEPDQLNSIPEGNKYKYCLMVLHGRIKWGGMVQ